MENAFFLAAKGAFAAHTRRSAFLSGSWCSSDETFEQPPASLPARTHIDIMQLGSFDCEAASAPVQIKRYGESERDAEN